MDKFDWFKNEFEKLSFGEQVDIYNRYCGINKINSHIYPMSYINMVYADLTPLEIIKKAAKYKINADDKYFTLTMGCFVSFNDPYSFLTYYLYDIYDIYKCKEAWEKDIDESGYFDEIYEEFYTEKPQDMGDDEYYDLIDKVVKKYELESQIVAYLGQNME